MDELFARRTGGPGGRWLENISAECFDFCELLAGEIIEREKEPIWRQVHAKIRRDFPADAPKSATAVRENVRLLVEERRHG